MIVKYDQTNQYIHYVTGEKRQKGQRLYEEVIATYKHSKFERKHVSANPRNSMKFKQVKPKEIHRETP